MSEYVAGVDSSTQSTKVVVWDPERQTIVRAGTAPHPDGTAVDPRAWVEAFYLAAKAAGGLDDVGALAVGGQQHGLVTLDRDGTPVRDALLWNDTRSAKAATDLREELPVATWTHACGSAPVASLTVAKVRWLADNEPENLAKTAAICLPHDYLTWKIGGSDCLDQLTTDRSDASGTGYVDLHSGKYRHDLLAMALRSDRPQIHLPRIVPPWEVAGTVMRDIDEIGLRAGTRLGPGAGDNAAAALGLQAGVGDVVVSVGTSGVVSVVADQPVADDTGVINGFMDATGNWLPLACTLNGARILSMTAALLDVSFAEFDDLALSVSDSGGMEMLPYFAGERTPNLPDATASLQGMTLENWDRAHLAHAAVRSLCELLAGAADAVRACDVPVNSVRLIGGGARSRALATMLPDILGVRVDVPEPAEYVAIGAARQAARLS
ncbi:MAG: FGGY family carbohydrate kinase [Bowdeniella nasicola]|nr:FGGY family carbohydrate kinase [Bowdeniella nasicola]